VSVTKVGAVTSTTTNSVFYPSATYSESAVGTSAPSTKTRHIFLFGNSVATIETTPLVVGTTTTTTTAVTYTHSDHLGSANVVSDSAGNPIETLAYSPYGATSGDIKTPSPLSPATFSEQRTYIGQYADAGTNLSYLNARYYDGSRGTFLSEDPVFWEVGQSKDGKSALTNPQSLNSYSYANGNPIMQSDPSGRMVSEYQPYLPSGVDYSFRDLVGSYRDSNIFSRGSEKSSMNAPTELQCVTFIKDFAQKQFGLNLDGIGADYGNQTSVNKAMQSNPHNSGDMTVYSNGSRMMPQENDVISWSGHGSGHVGVIAEVVFDNKAGTGYVYTVEQNVRRDGALFVQPVTRGSSGAYTVGDRLSGYTVQGWARYGNQSVAPKYTSTQWTPASKAPIKNKK